MRHLVNLCEQAAGLRDIHTNSILIASVLHYYAPISESKDRIHLQSPPQASTMAG